MSYPLVEKNCGPLLIIILRNAYTHFAVIKLFSFNYNAMPGTLFLNILLCMFSCVAYSNYVYYVHNVTTFLTSTSFLPVHFN